MENKSRIVIFVRHGQSEANIRRTLSSDEDKYPLTKLGIEQAERTAKELRQLHRVAEIIASPVTRAVQTAKIVAPAGLVPRVDYRLYERRMGGLNGKVFESEEALVTCVSDEIKFGYPNGMETSESVRARVEDFMNALPEGEEVIAVSHRDTIRAALEVVSGNYAVQQNLSMPPASITVIDFDNKEIITVGSEKVPLRLLEE